VQVFGRRHAETMGALGRPASEKRQGTKSREVGHGRCRVVYGDLAARGGVEVGAKQLRRSVCRIAWVLALV